MEKFKELNPNVKITKKENNKILLSNLWNEKNFECLINAKDKKVLKDVFFPKTLAAIYHNNKKTLEFIFAPLPCNYDILKLNLSFVFAGKNFKCYFDYASETIKILSTNINILNDSDTDFRNLMKFNFYFGKGKFLYRKEIKPYSFFVKGNFDSIDEHFFVSLSKHINFYTHFFYRKFPYIQIYDQETNDNRHDIKESYCDINNIPNKIAARELNQTLLDILLIANHTQNIRLKYIFYYQILEYSAYYYLKGNIKNNLNNLLKNPDIMEKVNDYSSKIIELLKDTFNNNRDDLSILKSLINDNCSCNDIKEELMINKKYFLEDVNFKGGFQIKAICDKDIHMDTSVMNAIIENLNSIRNVLVHLREKREYKIILPNKENDEKIKPYLFLLKRLAEKITINIGNNKY